MPAILHRHLPWIKTDTKHIYAVGSSMGGLGRPLGPLVAGIVIGVSESVTMALTSPSWAPLVSFSLLILVLLVRPGKLQ